ncbi:MAG: orotidine-5'-phosphate decarboxylase, partial [Oscillospiraceae bacterium]|nr:orotidine-5'-phosphate decarboxylase [Oscillospiraceae bacterium]
MDVLCAKIIEKQNPTVVGLDPKLEYIPEYIKQAAVEKHGAGLKAAAAAILRFNKELIDAVCDIVPAVKPQAAYYEMYGHHGVKALEKTIAYAKEKGLFVILDGKRNDIGPTMQAYAAAYLGATDVFGTKEQAFAADALTVNGYLGTDGVKPALETGGGLFITPLRQFSLNHSLPIGAIIHHPVKKTRKVSPSHCAAARKSL